MSVIVTTAMSPKALIVTRSLGIRGIKVTTADKQKFALASLSKYSKNFFLYPSPKKKPAEFINCLISFIKRHRDTVLIPTHSEDTYLIAKYKSSLEKYIKVPLHDYNMIKKVNDKACLMEIAEELSIPIPRTRKIKDLSELPKIAEELDFPVVIKLRETSSSIGLSYAHSKKDLISKYKKTVSSYDLSFSNYPVIQEYIPGDGYGVSLLFNKGDLRAKFTHKRLREYPITGGPSTYRVSVKNSKMEKFAINLLQSLNWHGVAMVEFKLDSRNKKPVLMEVNPRMWGSINLAIKSGIDFPYLLYKMVLEGDVKPVFDYKLGIKTRNIFIDYLALISYIRKTKNVKLLKEFFKIPKNDDILSIKDPIPILGIIRIFMNEFIHSRYKNNL